MSPAELNAFDSWRLEACLIQTSPPQLLPGYWNGLAGVKLTAEEIYLSLEQARALHGEDLEG